MRVGYARVSADGQDLEAQLVALEQLGVDRCYTDTFSGVDRDRPGLAQALASLRAGDTLVVYRLDRLGRSVRDLRDIADELTSEGVCLQIGQSVYDPADPVGKMLFTAMAMMAEFERDLISQRTREGMAIARRRGKLRGRQSLLTQDQRELIVKLYDSGEHSMQEIGDMLGISRSTVSRVLSAAR
ncbi:recombinase family protein [Stomatohabitans albus]|uniref:recombinase family protein n=1 Tax=Stomatohabitans albus TaxID=3110766 RepID=UPI00300C4710